MKKKAISLVLALVLCLGLTVQLTAASAFSDVPYGHWAFSDISQASAKGWIKGTGGDLFAPGSSVTAAEFFNMTANAFFPEELAAQPQGEYWYSPVWALARQLSLQKGTSIQDEESLTVPLSRQDMAQIVCSVLTAKGLPLPESSGTFADWAEIPERYRAAISTAAELGILRGKEGNVFAPGDTMTRAEAAVVLCRMATALYPLDVLRLVNEERAKEGLAPLRLDPVLMAAARIRASELKVSFSHTRPNGQSCMFAIYDAGSDPYDLIRSGENIASGFSTPESVMDGWMNSPGHRSNILTKGFTVIGIGVEGRNWVQMFGRWDWE